MNIIDFIAENTYVLVPVLYIIGVFLKKAEFVADKYIPLILMGCGIVLGLLVVPDKVQGIIQGVLVAGAAVLGNQVYKQMTKEDK